MWKETFSFNFSTSLILLKFLFTFYWLVKVTTWYLFQRSVEPGQFKPNFFPQLFQGRGLYVVYFPQLVSDVSLCVLLLHFILVIVPWVVTLPLYLEHFIYIHFARFLLNCSIMHFLVMNVWAWDFWMGTFNDNSVKFWQIYALYIWKGVGFDLFFAFCTQIQLWVLFIFVPILIVWFGESIC